LAALAQFIVRPTEEARAAIRLFAARAENSRRHRKPVPVESLEPVGEFYDLGPIAARLNRRYFGGRLRFDITWGRRVPAGRRRRQRQITLGLCHSEDRVIRIHRILDSPDVPLFYLEYVIYHEMAHLAVPS